MSFNLQPALNRGIRESINEFEIDGARKALKFALKQKPDADTYYLASMLAETEEEKLKYLEIALDKDPFHEEAFAEYEHLTTHAIPMQRSELPQVETSPKQRYKISYSDQSIKSAEKAKGFFGALTKLKVLIATAIAVIVIGTIAVTSEQVEFGGVTSSEDGNNRINQYDAIIETGKRACGDILVQQKEEDYNKNIKSSYSALNITTNNPFTFTIDNVFSSNPSINLDQQFLCFYGFSSIAEKQLKLEIFLPTIPNYINGKNGPSLYDSFGGAWYTTPIRFAKNDSSGYLTQIILNGESDSYLINSNIRTGNDGQVMIYFATFLNELSELEIYGTTKVSITFK